MRKCGLKKSPESRMQKINPVSDWINSEFHCHQINIEN